MTRTSGERAAITRYGVGLALALLLTAAAFMAVDRDEWSAAHIRDLVFALGLVQMLVQFRCFLRRAPVWLLLFSTLIVALMVAGTLVVLFNQRSRMM